MGHHVHVFAKPHEIPPPPQESSPTSPTTKTAAVDARPDSRDFGMQVDMPALLRELEEIRRLCALPERDSKDGANFEICFLTLQIGGGGGAPAQLRGDPEGGAVHRALRQRGRG